MEYTYIHNHQSQFIELIRDCQTYLSISDLSLNFLKGITPTYVESSCVEIINQACVTWDGIDFSNVKYQNSESSFAKGILNSDDLLLTMTGRGTLGRCNIFFPENDDITYIADSHISILRVNKTLVLPIIIAKFISLSDTQDEIYRNYVTGSTNQLDIVFSKIKNFKIPVPPMALQEEFAAIVSQADKSKFDGFKSQFLEMTRTADRHPIGQLCDIFGGATPARTNKEYWENGTCPWFTVEDLHNQGAHIWKTEQHITEAALKKVKKYPVDTVLLCCTSATIGSVAYSHIPLSSNQQFNGLVVKDRNKLRPEFLFYNCTLLKDELLKQCGKTTFAFVPRGTLEKIEIFCPDIHVQNQFVKVLEQADKSKYYVQNKQNYICHILTNQIQ